MKKQTLRVNTVKQLQEHIYAMNLGGDCSDISAPGQFINIALEGFYLRRPISIYSYDEDSVTIIFKVVGQGTQVLAKRTPGDTLDVLMPLGNGFDTTKSGSRPLIVGGGIGVPPLYGLAEELILRGDKPQVIMGFGKISDVILEEEFKALGIQPIITTEDGSYGMKGFVTDAMKTLIYDYVYTCGPEAMLRAVYDETSRGQFSFESRMACGFGVCMGCTCKTKYGHKRICKDGPVLYKEEIQW